MIALFTLLSGCASNYEARCIEGGYESGSQVFADCVEQVRAEAAADRAATRRRHRRKHRR
jgi:hypothetical protein